MIYKLDVSDFEKVRPLTSGVRIACAVEATLDGTCPGSVWVDEPLSPRCALVETPEGHYVLGDAPDGGFLHALVAFVAETFAPGGRGEDWWWFALRSPSGAWSAALREAFPEERFVEKPREFYVCEEVTFDWRERIPTGFELLRVDAQLLARDDLVNIAVMRRRLRSNFGTCERFLEKGFAFCVVHNNTIVSDCRADNVSGGRCEVGVETSASYRQRGLASLCVAAAADWALANGFEQVGWHCLRYNAASAATARKVGFYKVQDYAAFFFCAKPADTYLFKGNLCLLRGEFPEASVCYEKALRAEARVAGTGSYLLNSPDERSRYLFQIACAQTLSGKREAGIASLNAALEASGYRQGGY